MAAWIDRPEARRRLRSFAPSLPDLPNKVAFPEHDPTNQRAVSDYVTTAFDDPSSPIYQCGCGGCDDKGCAENPLRAPNYAGSCELKGGDECCAALAEDVQYSEAEYLAIDPGDYADSVHIVDATGKEEHLLRWAWAVLNENKDLIGWALCYITGKTGKGDCIVGHIERSWPANVNIRVHDCDDHYSWAVPGVGFGGFINFCRDTSLWRTWLNMWTDAPTEADRACAVIDCACVLAHELAHLCLRSFGDESGDCDVTYMLGNAVRWGLVHRYPFVESGCCRDFGLDSVFADDTSDVSAVNEFGAHDHGQPRKGGVPLRHRGGGALFDESSMVKVQAAPAEPPRSRSAGWLVVARTHDRRIADRRGSVRARRPGYLDRASGHGDVLSAHATFVWRMFPGLMEWSMRPLPSRCDGRTR